MNILSNKEPLITQLGQPTPSLKGLADYISRPIMDIMEHHHSKSPSFYFEGKIYTILIKVHTQCFFLSSGSDKCIFFWLSRMTELIIFHVIHCYTIFLSLSLSLSCQCRCFWHKSSYLLLFPGPQHNLNMHHWHWSLIYVCGAWACQNAPAVPGRPRAASDVQ